MIQDPNTERLIREYIRPLENNIAALQKDIQSLRSGEPINKLQLTNEEKQAIKVLNFIAIHDGIIDDVKYLLLQGIEKFIAKNRRHLVTVIEREYPIRIVIIKSNQICNTKN